MTNILVNILRISGNKLKCTYLKNQKPFPDFSLRFWNLHQILRILQKKKKKHESHRLSISEIIDSGRSAYLNI